MSERKATLGQAIDSMIEALEPLDIVSRQTAVNAVCAHLGLESSIKNSSSEESTPLKPDNNNSSNLVIDIRTFKDQKNPKTAVQMACLVAYYLQELAPQNERKETINSTDLTKYFKQAGYKLPKAIPQLLPDARVAGYFESAPGKGEYSLNAVGYNLVAHNLPKS